MATPSRVAVARTLHLVFGEGARVPDAWDAGLAAGDAGLANALLGQCLRRWGTLQAAIRPQLKDPGRGLPLGTQVALAIGLAQLAWLPGVSDHAAVNEAVDLATSREVGFPPHKGLVNAILRRAARDRAALAAGLDRSDPALDRTPFTDRVLRAALAPRAGGSPDALWRRLQAPPRPHFRMLRDEPLPQGLEPVGAVRGRPGPGPRRALPGRLAGPRRGHGPGPELPGPARLRLGAPGHPDPGRLLRARRQGHGPRAALPGGPPGGGGAQCRPGPAAPGEPGPARRPGRDRGGRRRPLAAAGRPQLRPHHAGRALQRLRHPAEAPGAELAGRRLGPGASGAGPARAPGGGPAPAGPRRPLIYAVCSWLPEEGLAHREHLLATHPGFRPAALWPASMGTGDNPATLFRPDPMAWPGEGFQAFAFTTD